MNTLSLPYARLAAQKALLGLVTGELRSVLVDVDEKKQELYIRFFYHGAVEQSLLDQWRKAMIEIHQKFDPHSVLDGKAERIDYPSSLPFRGAYAYLRKE